MRDVPVSTPAHPAPVQAVTAGVTLYRTQLTTAAQGHVKYEPSAGTVLTTWRIRHTFPTPS